MPAELGDSTTPLGQRISVWLWPQGVRSVNSITEKPDSQTNNFLKTVSVRCGREPAPQSTLDGRPFGVIAAIRELLAGHVIHKVPFLITPIIRNGTFRVQVGSAHLH